MLTQVVGTVKVWRALGILFVAELSLESFHVREELAQALHDKLDEEEQGSVGKVSQLDLSLDKVLSNLEERCKGAVNTIVAALRRF